MKHIMLLIIGVSFVLGFIASFWNEEIYYSSSSYCWIRLYAVWTIQI